MRIDIITVLPELLKSPFEASILKRAIEAILVEVHFHNLRDYTTDNYIESGVKYDIIFDAVGKMMTGIPVSAFKNALVPGGTMLTVDMGHKDKEEDLITLKEMIEKGGLKPVIDRRYSFEEIPEAHKYVEQKHKKGNVVITVSS